MTHRKCNVCNTVMLFDHDGCECTAKRKRKIGMTEDERNQYESTLWELEHDGYIDAPALIRKQQEKLTKYELRHEEQRKRIDELEAYQKHDVELAEAVGWDKGYEAGRQLGMKQERALWELAASTQEIMNERK